MASRDIARRIGNRDRYKVFRTKVIKLIKRDRIQGVLKRLQKNPGPQCAWQEAKSVLGQGAWRESPGVYHKFQP